MTITSDALDIHGQILRQYTCEGDDLSPPLTFSEIPAQAKSLALIVEDPDAPSGVFTHWLLYDMSPATLQLPEDQMPPTGTAGVNDFGQLGYSGPCPPAGTHRYFFRLFALDVMLGLPEGVAKQALQQAMSGHAIAMAELVGTYEKTSPRNG